MSRSRGYEQEDFEKAIELEKDRIKQGDWFHRSHFSYVDRGFYYRQIKRFMSYLDVSNMLFVIFERIISDPVFLVEKIFGFLDVEVLGIDCLCEKKNPAFVSRFTFLRDVLYSQSSSVRKAGRVLIPTNILRRGLLRFLERINSKPIRKPNMKTRTKKKLREIYKEDITNLEQLIGQDLSFWLEE